ncbi:MAG: hypothetical protein ABI360_06185 [Allobranchiibius sp.]
MTARDTTKLQGLWTGLGISMGGSVGALIGLFGWGVEGIAFGLIFGAGVGLTLGASYDTVDRRRRASHDGEQTRPAGRK